MSEEIQNMAAPEQEVRGRWAAWVGFFLHLVIGVFPYAASGLLAPLYAIAIVYVGWFVLLFFVLRWWNRTPYRVLLVPVIALAWWFAFLSFGEYVLGWDA